MRIYPMLHSTLEKRIHNGGLQSCAKNHAIYACRLGGGSKDLQGSLIAVKLVLEFDFV
jgi:hypothetical protein